MRLSYPAFGQAAFSSCGFLLMVDLGTLKTWRGLKAVLTTLRGGEP